MDDRHAWIGTLARRLGGAYLASHLIPRDNIRVAMTHHVFDDDLEQFDRIVRCLSTQREFIAPRQFFDHYDEDSPKPISGKSLLWTFDDGLLSSYNATQLVLNPLGIKAIFFIPTVILEFKTHQQMRNFVHGRILFGTRALDTLRTEEYVTMNAKHLQELHKQGHMILPHTHSHIRAREITTNDDVAHELMRPKRILEDLLQSPADAVAIPVGTPRTVSAYSYAQIASVFSQCFTALGGPNTDVTDPRFLRRDSIHPWYSAEHARNIVDGIFDPYFGPRMRTLRRRAGGRYLPARREARPAGRPVPSPAMGDARARFVARVAETFEQAGVDYVFLHAGEDRGIDSDLDVAVARGSLHRTDALVRSGAFGRVVQCLHHGVPWCRYYVIESEEPGRRYRQLDVVCDPWGIGPDGQSVPVALSSAALSKGVRVPEPAAETLYLAVKRARKRRYGLRDQADLARVFQRDPEGAARLLEQHMGRPGAALARALKRRKPDVTEELRELRRQLAWQRRSPAALARRGVLEPLRIVRRLLRPTGLAVCIVGRDADSKSLAARLERETDGVFRRVVHLGSGGRLTASPTRVAGRRQKYSTQPRGASTRDAVSSIAPAAFLWLGSLLRWWPRIALSRARASLVIIEGGWVDVAADPGPYRVSLPPRVTRILGCALPRPDLTLFVDGSSDLSRKPDDVGAAEGKRRLDAWRELAGPDPDDFDYTSTVAENMLQLALGAIDDVLAGRQLVRRAWSGKYERLDGACKPSAVLSARPGELPPAEAWREPSSKLPMTGTKRKERRVSG